MVDNESLFPDRVTRDPQSGIITSIDARVINIALTRISGIDVGMGGSYSTSIGEFEPSLAATYMYQYDEKLSPNSPLRSNLAVRQSTGWAPRWKIVPRIGWSYQDIVYASLAGRYVRSEEHTSELQSLMRISYAVFCLKKKKKTTNSRY